MHCRRLIAFFYFSSCVAASSRGSATELASVTRCESYAEEKQAAYCLYQLAQTPESRLDAIHRMEQLHERGRDSGWFSFYLGHLSTADGAKAYYRQSIALFGKSGDALGEVKACLDLDYALYQSGDVNEAEREVAHATASAQRSPNPVAKAWGFLLEARHLNYLGNVDRSYGSFRLAKANAPTKGEGFLRLEVLSGLARTSLLLGHFDESRAAYQEILELEKSIGERDREAWAKFGLVTVATEELSEMPRDEERASLFELTQEALNAAIATKDYSTRAMVYGILGMLSTGASARRQFDQCLKWAPSMREKSSCQGGLARYLSRQDRAAAQAAVSESLALAEEAKDTEAIATAWREQMRLSWVRGSSDEAFETSQAALASIEAIRSDQTNSDSQAGVFSTWADDYHWLAGKLFTSYRSAGHPEDLERAFSVTERMHGRSLLEKLGTPNAPGQFATLAEVQKALSEDQALLSFQIAPGKDWTGDSGGGSWLLVVTRKSTRLYPLLDRLALRPSVRLFAGEFNSRDGSEIDSAERLYQSILAPAVRALPSGVRRLVIVPDDDLNRLPFAALRQTAEAALAARYQISSVPSATVWIRLRRRDARGATIPALALADPYRPAAAGSSRENSRSAERGATALDSLPDLPRSREEGEGVVDALGGDSVLRTGRDASLDFLQGIDLRTFSVIHFATHALMDPDDPRRSAIVLASSSTSNRGLLGIPEIVHLSLDGQLVVLASCRSASGRILRGEGVMSLARAFFQAGSRTVVASLWPVRDDEAAMFFQRFYAHLAARESVAAALAGAQRDCTAARLPAAAWAAFVVLGDGDLVPLPHGRKPRPHPWLLLSVGACLLVLVLGAYLRSRPRPAHLPSGGGIDPDG